MIYPLLGITTGLTYFIYNEHQATSTTPDDQSKRGNLVQKNTFSQSTIQNYTQLKKEGNKYILYSYLHKQPLVTHKIVSTKDCKAEDSNNKDIQMKEKQTKEKIEKQGDIEDVSFNRNQTLYSKVFERYAQQLLEQKKCQTVQVIEGPIFPKDTPFKQKSEKIDQVFTSTIKMTPNGQYITDKYFSIVICNNKSQHFLNGFTMRRGYASDTFNLTRYVTSLIKIEEQTGLKFNIQGEPLTIIDYDNINKERKYADFE